MAELKINEDILFGKSPLTEIVEKIVVQRAKRLDDAIFGEINEIIKENEHLTVVDLNEKAIVEALEKQIPKKLVARDLFEMSTATGHSCPSCGYDFPIGIYRLYKYCPECGQAIER